MSGTQRYTVGLAPTVRFNLSQILACVIITLVLKRRPGAEIDFKRVSDPKVADDCDVLLGIGNKHDPDNFKFDPKGSILIRDDGSTYGLAGLVWHQYGYDLVGMIMPKPDNMDSDIYVDEVTAAALFLDERIFKPIDAEERLHQATEPLDPSDAASAQTKPGKLLREKAELLTLYDAIIMMNPMVRGDYDALGNRQLEATKNWDNSFSVCLEFVTILLVKMIASVFARRCDRIHIAEELKNMRDTGMPFLVLRDPDISWRRIVNSPDLHDVFLVIQKKVSPHRPESWKIYTVYKSKPRFTASAKPQAEFRLPFPEEWIKSEKKGPELAAEIDIQGALFIQPNGEIAGAETLSSALTMADRMLEIHTSRAIRKAREEKDAKREQEEKATTPSVDLPTPS